MPRPPDYGIIYNWDGNPHGYSEYPQSMDAFLEKVYGPMEDTQVGAHFWCIGEHTAAWKSEVLEMVGEVHGRNYESVHSYNFNENILAMLERGEDPQEEVIKRGRELGMHVYASVRMNDNHFGGAQVEDLPEMHDSGLTKMRIEHPEWLLGEQAPEWFALSWNFEVPEVREHRFAHIKEICGMYDWDGVELDWQRHAFHLPADHGYRLRYVLTDLQRAVRQMADELAEARGRPFYLAARVAPTLEMCRRVGYDVPAWIDEGLVDILIPAGGAHTDPSIDPAPFLDLCWGTDTVVYPGFDARLDGWEFWSFVGPESPEIKDRMRTRAVASLWHRAGSDGIYAFNWHGNRNSRRGLLQQIGSPDTLRSKNKIYAATHRYLQKEGEWRGAFQNDRLWGEVPVALKRTLTSEGPTIRLEVADDVVADVPERVELRVRLDQWTKGDVVRLFWDGKERKDVEARYHLEEDRAGNPFGAQIYDVGSAAWLYSQFTPSEVTPGPHQVRVVLDERNPRLARDIVLTNVELVVSYGEAGEDPESQGAGSRGVRAYDGTR